jgi:hypothetical protein
MTVEILALSGLSAAEARQAADELLDLDTGPERLERLLVLDDTGLLCEHEAVYARIDNAKRVEKLLCVSVGPRADGGRRLTMPGNLGGNQGWPVLWISRPAGINWKVARAAVANRYPGTVPTALEQHPLVKLVLVDAMFDRIQEAFLGTDQVPAKVRDRVASPGLWLRGAEDEAATFAGALAVAARRVCEPGPGSDRAFAELLPDRTGGASLSDSGPLARDVGRVGRLDREARHALAGLAGVGGMFRRGGNGVAEYVSKAGEALADLRHLVRQVLREANVAIPGELTAQQRDFVRNAGVEFDAETMPPSPYPTALAAAEQSVMFRAVAVSVRGGDSIPVLTKRLTATERAVQRRGSASYLPETDKYCPPELLTMLADPPRKFTRQPVADARRDLGLAQAADAAQALSELILTVANREWSLASVTSRDLAALMAALEGVRKALTDQAGAPAGGSRTAARGARLSRLAEGLLPTLRDLVLHVVLAEIASPSATGREARQAGQDRTAVLLKEWNQHVRAHGVTAQPPFAAGTASAPHVIEDDVAEVRDALVYPAREEMWQLCAPADLSVLDTGPVPVAIRFASRLNKEALAGLPGDELVWTSSGSFAGQLRLVPLLPGVADSRWSETPSADPPTAAGL